MGVYKELSYVDVALKMYRTEIGTARVYENGEITMRLSRKTDAGKTLYEFLLEGLADEVNVVPRMIPVLDAAKTTDTMLDMDMHEETTVIPAVKDEPMPRLRSLASLGPSGLLWLINRVVFHPRGRALALVFDENNNCTGWRLMGNGKKVWWFNAKEDQDLFERAERTLRVDTVGEEKEGI